VPKKEKSAKRDSRSAAVPAKSRTIVRLDRKGRGGKQVTVIEGLPISVREAEALLRRLKAKLGTGGTMNSGTLEIQGDHCDAVIGELTGIGYKPKRSGG